MKNLLENIKHSRTASFIVVAIIYVLAFAVGFIAAYFINDALDGGTDLYILFATVISTIVVFIFSVIFGNASVYDPYWSVQPIVYCFYALVNSYRVNAASVLALIAVCLWGVRLTANWAYTFHGLDHQDWRYTMLHDTTGIFYPFINFVGIHMVPTLVVYGCMMPAVMSVMGFAEFTPWTVVFFIGCLACVTLQGTADVQMHKFRKRGTGGFIRDGVWKNARHPNYLAEISMWWCIALMLLTSHVALIDDAIWMSIIGAAANTVLFFAVSIPMAERKQAKKEGFAEYKKETRFLLPIPKFPFEK